MSCQAPQSNIIQSQNHIQNERVNKDNKYLEENKFVELGEGILRPLKYYSHKHKFFAFGFCWYMWTSHFKLFLLISNICISFNLNYFI